jgi:hypothetical protein
MYTLVSMFGISVCREYRFLDLSCIGSNGLGRDHMDGESAPSRPPTIAQNTLS